MRIVVDVHETKSGIAEILTELGASGTTRDPSSQYWFNHASNAALSGSPQQGADDHWIAWSKADLTTPSSCDSGAPVGGVCDGGWDKSSDINVQVFASRVATDRDLCKRGGWQTLVRLDGTSFRNQGDCVSYAEHHNGKGNDDHGDHGGGDHGRGHVGHP